jgi:hypothetical protein
MKCSNLVFKTHQQTFQYYTTFFMMMIMLNIHKDCHYRQWTFWFVSWESINDDFGFVNQS